MQLRNGTEAARIGFPWRIWLLCFLTYACFYTPIQNSNVTTRIGLALSIVERHTLTIDPYEEYTIDRAELNGHFYADKAPGLSLLALPLVAALDPMVELPPVVYDKVGDGRYAPGFVVLVSIVTLCTVGALTATATAILFQWARRRGASVAGASFAALAFGIGSPLLPWSTTFFGHAATASLLLIGFALLSGALRRAERGGRAPLGRGALAGFVLGAAFTVEFPAGPAVAIIAMCCAAEAVSRRLPWRPLIVVFLAAGLGLAAPLAALAAYNGAAFGAPLHLGYGSVQDFPGMRTGFFGVSLPQPLVIKSLLIGQYRGLLPMAPVLLLAPFGWIACLRLPQWRTLAIASALVFVWFLLMNAGYYYWHGGFSSGPRHLLPGLCLLTLPLAPLWDRARRGVRLLAGGLLAVSLVIAILVAALDVHAPEWAYAPFPQYFLPLLTKSDLMRLLANAVGIHGYAGLLPVLAVWGVVGAGLFANMIRSALGSGRTVGPATVEE